MSQKRLWNAAIARAFFVAISVEAAPVLVEVRKEAIFGGLLFFWVAIRVLYRVNDTWIKDDLFRYLPAMQICTTNTSYNMDTFSGRSR